MTIDKAIANAREKAKEIRENIIDGDNLEPYESYCITMADKSAEEHEQLAEWLEELKELRNMTAGHLYAVAFNIGYLKAEKETRNKAIDDCLILINANRTKFRADICYSDLYDSIVQLKAGGGNGA